MIQIHWKLGLDCHLLIAFLRALGSEGQKAPARVLVIDKLDAHWLPDVWVPGQDRQSGLVYD